MNQKLLAPIVALLILAGILIVGSVLGSSYSFNKPPGPIACTQEAKQCSDGSYVGRTGPNCEFAACPSAQEEKRGTLKGNMTIGPICPVERIDQPCKPTPEMYAARKVFVYNSNAKGDKSELITTLTPNAEGDFSATLSVGEYLVDVNHQAVGGVSGVPTIISIKSGETTKIDISIDTGIR